MTFRSVSARARARAWATGLHKASPSRDPFVFRAAGYWWMTFTAMTRERSAAIGIARSDDGLSWEDQGPLLIGEVGEPLESSQLLHVDGRWFLAFTPGPTGGVWYIDGADFHGPWNYSARERLLDRIDGFGRDPIDAPGSCQCRQGSGSRS